ncbi:DUF1212-domain-containing protein [Serendipita vermifera]|nr:DUF1212-domain-containing protein [Serendipita vermifera]
MPVDDETRRGREPEREVAVDPESLRDHLTKEHRARRHVQWGPDTKRSISRGRELDEKGQDSNAFSSLKNSLLKHREQLASESATSPTQALGVFVDSMETEGLPQGLNAEEPPKTQDNPSLRSWMHITRRVKPWKSEKNKAVEDGKEDGRDYDINRRKKESWDFRYGEGSGILSTLLAAYDRQQSNNSSGASTPYSTDADSPLPRSASDRDENPSPRSTKKKSRKSLRLDNILERWNSEGIPESARTGAGVMGPLIAMTGNLSGVAASKHSAVGPDVTKEGHRIARYTHAEEDKSQPSTRPPSIVVETGPSTPVHENGNSPESPTSRADWAGATLRDGRKRLSAALKALTPTGSRTTSPNTTDTEEDPKERKPKRKRIKRKRDDIYITEHVAEIIHRQDFILKLARAFLMFGAPSHRLETQLQTTGRILGLNVSCMYLPNIVLISFNDTATGTSNVKLIKQGSTLDLGKLLDAYALYWAVIHDKISVSDASSDLDQLILRRQLYKGWITVVIGGFCSSFICPIAFNGSFLDAIISFPLGALLVFIQNLSAKNELYSNVFEIVIATLISFVAGALASTGFFCYSAVASASIVLILPGYIILCGALEMASRNIVAGAVRMCYAVIYSLFLGFGLAMGGEVYHQIFGGVVTGNNDYGCTASHTAHGEWWRRTPSPYWAFLCVPMYALFLTLRNQSPFWRRELYLSWLIACGGWTANHFASKRFVGRNDISSSLGALVVGIAGNLYGRLSKGNAFVVMITGILFQLPTGLSNGGLLAFASQSTQGSPNTYASGFQVAEQLVSVAVGLTVGLFVAAILVHPVPSRRRGTALFSL